MVGFCGTNVFYNVQMNERVILIITELVLSVIYIKYLELKV